MSFPKLSKNVWLLSIAHIFSFAGASVTFFLGGIIGAQLAPSLSWATMPVAAMVVGTALGTVPAAMVMSKKGRRFGFIGASIVASGSALVGAFALWHSHFWLYGLSCLTLGMSYAFVQHYRFAAAESVPIELAPKAISAILLSGVAGAFVGPNVVEYAQNWIPQRAFVGSYLALAVMVAIPAVILLWLKTPQPKQKIVLGQGRSIKQLTHNPDFILAVVAATASYALMVFIMTASPVSMHLMDGHSISHAGMVIQWHIVGMFLPSLFIGSLITYYGHRTMMLIGIGALIVCISVSQVNQSVAGYWLSLVSLGIGWNFIFVSSTSLIITTYQEAEKYRAQGFNELMVFGAQAIASLSAGWLLLATSWQTINLMGLPLLGLLLMVIWWSYKKLKQQY
jgi:MFS family permease|tara:strand:+ start:345 stop:1529 length:1185 start_codon:yes stop_codon:yes gene_type:complete